MATKRIERQNKVSKQGLLFGDETGKKPEPSELMKVIAEKVPSKKKILKDFPPEEAQLILEKLEQRKREERAREGIANEDGDASKEVEEARRERIRRIKRIAKEMEIGNRSKVILFPSYSRNSDTTEWYKMGNFSALYYAYRMAERMGKVPKIQVDKDRFSKMHSIVCIRDIDKFVNSAMALGEFERYEITLDDMYVFHLKHELSDVDLALLRKTGAMQKEAMHNVLRSKKASPELYLTILMLGRQVLKATENLHGVYRDGIGNKIMQNAVELLGVYFRFANRMIDIDTAKGEMANLILDIRAGMAILGDVELVTATRICAIGETIVKIESLVKELK